VSRRAASLLAGLLLAFAGCGGDETDTAPAGRPVTLHSVQAIDLADRIEATGQLIAKQQASVAAEVAGRITEIHIDEGAPAPAEDAVISIDPERRRLERERSRAQFDQSRASLREQERESERIKELHERNVASQSQLDQAETQLKLARSRLLAAQAELGVVERSLRDANVSAPFAGLIAERFVSCGEYVTPGQKLFHLVSLDPILVEFSITEIDSGRVASGQLVEVRLAPFPDETFEARVSFVAPTIDTATRTLRVKADLENSDGRLRPGLFARVDLGVALREDVPVILEEAILQRADGAVVFRAGADDHVERVVIETGVHEDGYVEVVRGLRAGDLVVSRGHAQLVDGERIVPRNADGTLVTKSIPDVAGAPGAAP
jgi:membrane fusion protein (multidrug efflux system)